MADVTDIHQNGENCESESKLEFNENEIEVQHPTVYRGDFAFLPIELLLKVFAYIDFFTQKYVLASVCKNWAGVCKDPLLNRTFRIKGMAITTKQVNEMLTYSPFLCSLALLDRSDLHEILILMSEATKRLKVLRVEKCLRSRDCKPLCPSLLIQSLKKCRHLEELMIKDTYIDDKGRCLLFSLGSVLPNLRKLTLVNISITLREAEVRKIVKFCKKLEEVKILQMQGAQLTDKFVVTTSSYMDSRLKVLKINAPFLTTKSIESLKSCENLTKLHLKYCLRLTDAAINVMSDFTNLTSIDLTMALGVTTDAWVHLFSRNWMTNVTKIVIGQCDAINDDVLEAIGQRCSSLQHLGLAGCVNITQTGFFHVIFGCRKMRCLDLFYTPTKLLNCFPLLPQHMRHLRKLIYRSSGGLQGNKLIIGRLKLFLPDLEIVDTVDKIK